MDSQLKAVLTKRETALINGNHLPNRTGKSTEILPSTDIQDVPIDLSLKSWCSLRHDSQPICLQTTSLCNNKAEQCYWTDAKIRGKMVETIKDSTDTLEIVAEVTGLHQPDLSDIDSLQNSSEDSSTPIFTGCLLGQKGVTCEHLSYDQSKSLTACVITVKEEIVEVCIGESVEVSDDLSLSSGSPDEMNKIMTSGTADGTDTQGAIVSGANSSVVPGGTITALKTTPEDIATDRSEFTIRNASTSARKLPDFNGNVNAVKEVERLVSDPLQLNMGMVSGSDEPPIKGSAAEEDVVSTRKGGKDCSSLQVVSAYAIQTRGQKRREMDKEAKEKCWKGENAHLAEDRQMRKVFLRSSLSLSDFPRASTGLCDMEKLREDGFDADGIGNGRSHPSKLDEELLDLSLSAKGRRTNRGCLRGGLDKGIETTLFMEVDEIENEEADAEVGLRDGEKRALDLQNLEASLSSSSGPLLPSASPSVNPSLADVLFIDDQGVPYVLSPDGQKVLQVEPSKPQKAFTARPRPKSKQAILKDCTVNVAPSNQVLMDELPCQPSGVMPPCLISPALPESSDGLENVSPSGTKSNSVATPHSPTPSNLESQSQPIQITANSTTSSPILLLQSSISSTTPNKNPGLMTLSLPVSLTQNSSSTPLLFVLSPVASGSTPSTTSLLTIKNPDPSSISLIQTTSPSAISLPLNSVQPDSEPTYLASPSVPALIQRPCTHLSTISGKPSSPNSPSQSSPTDKPSPGLTCKEIIPKPSSNKLQKSGRTSFSRSNSMTENQNECPQSPISANLSPMGSPPSQLHHILKASPDPKPDPTSHTSANLLSIDDPPYPSSGTPPPEIIFPTNHPKNLSPNCPRRILYCQFCPRAFYYLSDLERHSITHSQSKPHVCPLCGKAFKRSSHLERHKHIHTGQRNFTCPICSKKFREAGELLRHQRVHTGEKPFQCPLCHMRFGERNTLRRHTKRKHQNQKEEGNRLSDGVQDSAEWYSSTVPDLDSDSDSDG
ncbi:hypothetical protein GJAV_G00006960 [Gymnothorax javanicus]|nr:hypothetical protein GJAV_G00006960 [Gymnothorax javanicus]